MSSQQSFHQSLPLHDPAPAAACADPGDNPLYQKNPLVYVATSSVHGHGLFASKPIARGDYIGSYAGSETDTDGMHVLWLYDEETEQWEGIDGDNEMRFLNHSDEPNADFWNTDLYALRDIQVNEEITFDYHWEAQP